MKYSLFPHHVFSFSHEFHVPIFTWRVAEIVFTISTQVPLFYNFPLAKRKFAIVFSIDKHLFTSAKFAMANLFPNLLRLTAAPCANWCSFLTFTHNVCNVMRGRKLSLRHSVKHYETLGLKNTLCAIITFN